MKKIGTLFLITIIFLSCEDKKEEIKGKDINISKTTEQIVQSDNEFGIDLFKRVNNSYPTDKNVFISPASAAFALAMTYNGANGETKEAMEVTLKKEGLDIDEINQSYKELMEGLKSADPKVTLNIANSIWYRNDFDVLPTFVQVNQNFFNAEVNSLDFSSPSTIDRINGWVSEKTNQKIKEIIDDINANSVMFLINAIYFNGTWKVEFKESDTKPWDFTPETGSPFKVDMMAVTDTFNYYSNNTFSAVDLPYGNDHYSMVVLLPSNQKTVDDIIAELTPENWNLWISSFKKKEVTVRLPKFKFEFEDILNNELVDMGMGVAFSDFADFTKINPGGGLQISMVKQKAFVDVNEKGTEAAAVTVVEIVFTSIGEDNAYFTADHPFLFVIMEKQTKSIVFIGRVAQPSYNK